MATTSAKDVVVFCADCAHSNEYHEHYTKETYCVFEDCECNQFIPMTTLRRVLKALGIGLLVIFIVLATTVQI